MGAGSAFTLNVYPEPFKRRASSEVWSPPSVRVREAGLSNETRTIVSASLIVILTIEALRWETATNRTPIVNGGGP